MPYFTQKRVYHVFAERGASISAFEAKKPVKRQNNAPTFRLPALYQHNHRNRGSSFPPILRLAAYMFEITPQSWI